MTTIDVHAHLLPPSAVRAAEEGHDWFGTTITRTADGKPSLQTGSYRIVLPSTGHWLAPKDRIPYLDKDGLDIQVLSISPQLFRDHLDRNVAIEASRTVNDELAEAVTEFPDRFEALAILPLQDTDAAVRELDRAVSELGLRGFIVGSHVAGTNWDDPRLFPILEEAERLGAFILLHPFNNRIREPLSRYHLVNLIGNPVETTIAAASLIFGGVLERLPDLRICLSYTGGYLFSAAGRFDHAFKSRSDVSRGGSRLPSDYLGAFYYDCISHSDDGLRQAIEAVGSGRILIGTDFPADMGLREPMKWLAGRDFLKKSDLEAIASGNARKLGFGARRATRAGQAAVPAG
jgi:aminocarboxymuconate-semialdehyde decarboxylase